jgi:predicted ribosome-associated RNA-binding protein Tma20
MSLRVYADTNVYSRPFDDISYPRINLEAEACLEVLRLAKEREIILASSDILVFEIQNSEYPTTYLCQKFSIKNLISRLSKRDGIF